jgi:hypothetical protein
MYEFDISPTGWLAEFQEERDGTRRTWHVPVEGFSPTGEAMMVGGRSNRLVAAKEVENFVALTECNLGVHFIPAHPGWSVEGEKWAGEKVVGWMVNDSGYGVPLVAQPKSGGVVPAGADGTPYTLTAPDTPRADTHTDD